MIKKLLIICLLLTSFSCSSLKDYVTNHYIFNAKDLRPPNYKEVSKKTSGFKTKDEINLVSDIYLPKGISNAPTILVRIPFTKTYYNQLSSELIARHWASRGYAVVIQGTRGRYKSDGIFYPLVHEREDGLETLNWLRSQPWYDGRILMWGGSSFGHTQWVLADQPLSALSIQISSTNFRKMFYPGGAFSLESALYWTIKSSGSEDREVDIENLLKATSHLPLIEADNIGISDTNFYNDWLINHSNDDYWNKIDGNHRASNIPMPVLLMGGWYDPFLPSQLEDYGTISKTSKNCKLIIGPWAHAQSIILPNSGIEVPYRSHSVADSTIWFDSVIGFSETKLPEVKIFVMGEDVWRDEKEWPLARTNYFKYYLNNLNKANTLNGDGFLSLDFNSKATESDSFSYDPLNPVPSEGGTMISDRAGAKLQNDLEKREDVLVYSTPKLDVPIEVTGTVKLILYVSTDVKSTDFVAKLVDVHPNGNAYNISEGILRKSYSGAIEKIEIEMSPTSNVFLKGHKIRLEVSSSNFPRYDRNLNTGEEFYKAKNSVVANQTVFHSKQHPSHILLPIIPR